MSFQVQDWARRVEFYSILSFAPLLVVVMGIIGLVFGHESAHGALVNKARQVIGEPGAFALPSCARKKNR
jgi:membrane protein